MKIGYPCMNNTLPCTSARTFRLASYSEEKLIEIVQSNLSCLLEILKWNVKNSILFFRITSDLVPFASHPVATYNWQEHFKDDFAKIGDYIRKNDIRVAVHPDQFVLLNSPTRSIVSNSIRELRYHAQILDLLKQGSEAKIQIHVGGVYGDKIEAMKRFETNYKNLSNDIKRRLVIENDDRLYSVEDCLNLAEKTGIPILLDTFHHEILNNGETLNEAFSRVEDTWKKTDGVPIIDYSSQSEKGRIGKHTDHIEISHFIKTLKQIKNTQFDVMLEIKDKETSALLAIQAAQTHKDLKI